MRTKCSRRHLSHQNNDRREPTKLISLEALGFSGSYNLLSHFFQSVSRDEFMIRGGIFRFEKHLRSNLRLRLCCLTLMGAGDCVSSINKAKDNFSSGKKLCFFISTTEIYKGWFFSTSVFFS